MKKKLTRILAALLIAMMLIPTLATFAVSAEEGTGETTEDAIDISDIVNVYELNKLNAVPPNGTGTKKDDEPVDQEGMLASKPFATSRSGDKYIYVGPCPDPANFGLNDPILYWYKSDGTYTSFAKIYDQKGDVVDGGNVVDRFEDGSVILRIRVRDQKWKHAALTVPTTYADFMLVTCERPFTVEEYYAYADAQEWKLDGTALRPAAPEIAEDAPEGYEGFWNYFALNEDYVAPTTQKEAANKYQKSGYISVAEGDVITIGAVSTKENQAILYAYSNETEPGKNTGALVTLEYKQISQYKRTDNGLELIEIIGYDYAIYSYTVPEGVSFVKVAMPESTYAAGDVLVTKNQAFEVAQYREALEIPALTNDAKNHAFNGKTALFVGDSVFAGEYDTPASFSNPTTAIARRFALATGLIPTVFAADGATIGQTGKTNVKCAYDLLRTATMSKKNYDMVILQGGVNDARQGIAVGEVLPVETEYEVLADKDRTKTFVGNLQLMFYEALNKWTDAEFYFIANYKVSANVTNKDMSEYYAQAKALCEIYGVHYIDLYNDTELYTSFDYNNAELFADDQFTPLSATYDAVFPSVLRLFNSSLSEELVNPFAPVEEETLPPVNNENETEDDGADIGLIIGIAVAGVVVLAGGGFALYWFVIRKKAVKATPVSGKEEAPASEPEANTAEEKTVTEEENNSENKD